MRSKSLLVSNLLASIYCLLLSWALIGLFIIDAGGGSIINAVGGFFESAFKLLNLNLAITNYLYVLGILLLIHVGLFVVGCIVSWVAYALKKDSVATVAAIVYLIGTVCSPVCLVFGILITTLTFIGTSNQRKLNKTTPL